jgi:hypothetical protein
VGFFTRKPAKLVLQFSDFSLNFYGFYKLWPKTNKRKETIFTRVPEKFQSFTNIPSGQELSQLSPLAAEASSPPVRWGRRRPTNGSGLRLGSPLTDWRLRLGRRSPVSGGGEAVAAGPRSLKFRRGSGGVGQLAAVRAPMRPREEVRRVHWLGK